MTPEARAFLDSLDDLCLKRDQTSKDVMAALTAIRALDTNSEGHLKGVVTIPIRRAVLPKCAAAADESTKLLGNRNDGSIGRGEGIMRMTLEHASDAGRADFRSLRRPYAARESLTSAAERHWAGHAEQAALALGLTVIK